MSTHAEPLTRKKSPPASESASTSRSHGSDVVRYFDVAGPDYEAWSPECNMHFGWWEKGMSRVRREPMLERMNAETLARLRAGEVPLAHVADLGCGVGATARYIARRVAGVRVSGFTNVPVEVEDGNEMSRESGMERVTIELCDYRRTPCADASVDGAYAIASACYADGADKSDLLAEMARIVKPGGRVVISDGFRKDSEPLGPVLRRAYEAACGSWAIGEMADIARFKKALRAAGFQNVCAEEVSWKIAPSYAHVPFLCTKFALQQWIRGRVRWAPERWRNWKGPMFGAVLGMARRRFGYFIVSAVRESRPPPAPREW